MSKNLVNPFKPTAGMTPPVLVGRSSVLDDFTDGLDEGAGAPGRLMRITGPRGRARPFFSHSLGNSQVNEAGLSSTPRARSRCAPRSKTSLRETSESEGST